MLNSSIFVMGSSSKLPLLACALAAFLLSGCNKGPKLVDINGKVNVDGQPTEGIGLLFFEKTSKQIVASAKSGPGGAFTVMTEDLEGIPEGNYLVAASYPDPKFVAPKTSFGAAPPDAPDLLKGRYVMAKTTVSLDVTSSTVDPVIELKSK